MKKVFILIFTILLCSCSSLKQDIKETNQEKQNENINNKEQTQDEGAIQNLKQYLAITNENENLFTFEILDRESTFITLRVLLNEIQNNGGSGTVGTYIIYINGKVIEKLIPDDLIGVWSGKNDYSSEDITYTFTKDNKITINNNTYIITNCNTIFSDQISTYEFTWDVEAFKQMYGNDSIGLGPQALVVSYYSDTDTIDVGTILKKVNK